jgi:hypothetical protein
VAAVLTLRSGFLRHLKEFIFGIDWHDDRIVKHWIGGQRIEYMKLKKRKCRGEAVFADEVSDRGSLNL